MTIQEKAAKVRVKRAELETQFPDGDCVLVSVENGYHNTVGGNTVEVAISTAAPLIVIGTHRLASKEEIDAFRKKQDTDARQIIEREIAKKVVYQAPAPQYTPAQPRLQGKQ